MIQNIFINGVQVNNANTFLAELGNIGSSVVEFNNYRRGGVSGQVLSIPQKRGFNISIKLKVIGTDYASYYQNRDRLLSLFENNQSSLKTLSFELADGTIKDIDVLFSEVSHGISSNNLLHGEFTVTAVSEKEYLKGRDELQTALTIKNLGGMAVPMNIPMAMNNSPVDSLAIVTNDGNAKGYPHKIEIKGVFASGFTIKNETTGEQFDYSDDLLVTDTIVIDCYNRTILKNGTTNVLQYVDGDWLSIISGENYFTLTGGTGSDNGSGVIYYNKYYLNV